MAGGLTDAKTELAPDGKTVITTFDSAAAAREHQALLESEARRIEGGWGAKFNGWLDQSLSRADETRSLFSRTALRTWSWLLALFAIILAWNAWAGFVPTKGLDLVLAATGATLVLVGKWASSEIHPAHIAKDQNKENMLCFAVGFILILEAVAATSLQASIAFEQETGRTDVQSTIDSLRLEQSGLQLTIAQKPPFSAEAQQKLIDGFLLKQVVNDKGVVQQGPAWRIGARIGTGEERCRGSSYYVTAYCPTILEMEAQRDMAADWEKAKERFDAIPAEIKALEAQRPKQSSIPALLNKLKIDTDWSKILFPAIISLILTGLTFATTYLAHRTPPPPAQPQTPVPPASPVVATVTPAGGTI
jgi:hypothetical protein